LYLSKSQSADGRLCLFDVSSVLPQWSALVSCTKIWNMNFLFEGLLIADKDTSFDSCKLHLVQGVWIYIIELCCRLHRVSQICLKFGSRKESVLVMHRLRIFPYRNCLSKVFQIVGTIAPEHKSMFFGNIRKKFSIRCYYNNHQCMCPYITLRMPERFLNTPIKHSIQGIPMIFFCFRYVKYSEVLWDSKSSIN